MELPFRKRDDVYLPDGTFSNQIKALRKLTDAHDLAIGIFYAFDFRTHMLPFWYADKRMAPCSVRLLGDVLQSAGFMNVRIVLQQWSPNVLPSQMRLNGKPLDILLVSSMQVHAERSYALVRDAHDMGRRRPFIIAGGPKAIYEPTDYFDLGPQSGVGADCVVTGEAFVLLDLLYTLLAERSANQTPLQAFEDARSTGALNNVPGLVYLSPDTKADKPLAINTGVQRLLRDLDELPIPDAGYRILEAPHRGQALRPKPLTAKRVGKLSSIASVISTQGCRFNCSYCPIPAVNQRTWRHKSPKRLAAEIVHIHENFGISRFFSTDDNFFNDRQTVIDLMTELAGTKIAGQPFAKKIRFFTEATQFDVYKNRDLLPLARQGGLAAIWFGIEDLTAKLVNKGQTSVRTAEVFDMLHKLDIEPMAMMIHSDAQPLHASRGDLSGLLNQARYLFKNGAVSYQCTYLGPAIGTRDIEPAAKAKAIFKRVGYEKVPEAFLDGNHVVSSKHAKPWERQFNIVRAYVAFYNPFNTLRTLLAIRKDTLGPSRFMFQIIGQIGLLLTVPKLFAWSRKLQRGPIEFFQGLERARIPMMDSTSGQEVDWALENIPSFEAPTPARVEFTDSRVAVMLPQLSS